MDDVLAAIATLARVRHQTPLSPIVHAPPSVFVLGPAGAGKSTLAADLAAHAAAHGIPVLALSGRALALAAVVDTASRPLAAALKARKHGGGWVVVDDADELVLDLPPVARVGARLFARVARANTSTFIVIGAADVPRWAKAVERNAASVGALVRLSPPTMATRRALIAAHLAALAPDAAHGDVRALAQATAGGSARDVVAGLRMAELAGIAPADGLAYAMATLASPHSAGSSSAPGPAPVPWAGYDAVRARLRSLVTLRTAHPELAAEYGLGGGGGGILLYGPPGVGKSVLGARIAELFGDGLLRSFAVTLTDILSPYVGESEARIRAVFERAREAAPAVVFFDELDALGASRATSGAGSSSGASDVTGERVLTQLLTELDGVSARGAVIVVGATSRPHALDSALLRPGRFDALVHIPLPDAPSRAAIVAAHAPHAAPAAAALADATEGFSGADLAALLRAAGGDVDTAAALVASGAVVPSVTDPSAHDFA